MEEEQRSEFSLEKQGQREEEAGIPHPNPTSNGMGESGGIFILILEWFRGKWDSNDPDYSFQLQGWDLGLEIPEGEDPMEPGSSLVAAGMWRLQDFPS